MSKFFFPQEICFSHQIYYQCLHLLIAKRDASAARQLKVNLLYKKFDLLNNATEIWQAAQSLRSRTKKSMTSRWYMFY